MDRRDKVYIPVSNVRLQKTEHLFGGLGHLNEHTIVDLKKTEELKDLLWLGGEVIDTKSSEVSNGDIFKDIVTDPLMRTTK